MYTLADKVGQFVGILTRGWHPDSAWPIIIHMGHFKRKALYVINFHLAPVMNYKIMGWGNCPLG